MAVVARNRKKSVVYYVVHEWNRKPAWEKVGTSKREAEIRDRAMKREIETGTYRAPTGKTAITVAQFAEQWGSKRTNASAPDERRSLRLYVLSRPWFAEKRMSDIDPADDVDRLVAELKAEEKLDGSRRLSDKTIANAIGVLHLVFAAGMRAKHCIRNPITLEAGTLRRKPAVEAESYTVAEALVLTRHNAIPWPIRVLNALCLFGGLREGEACGRRWKDLDPTPKPLPCLTVRDQYGGRKLKTERPRVVPVHPELARVLGEWGRDGFELYASRRPTPDDFIVPAVGRRMKTAHHTRSTYYKAFIRGCEASGVRARSLHATRHTFISLCRRGGARPDVLERVTHNSSGKIIDRYTHFDWAPLCEAVLCLDVHQGMQPPSGNPGELGANGSAAGRNLPNASALLPVFTHGSTPGASTTAQQENSHSVKPRQDSRQESERIRDELRESNRRRRRKLQRLSEVDEAAARPGIAVCGALDKVLSGDLFGAVALLKAEAGR